MSLEGHVWNKNNADWRELVDSTTIAWSFATEGKVSGSIPDDAITFAKFQNIATDRLLGRDTVSSGNLEEIALSTGLEFTGSASIRLANTAVSPGSYTNASFTVDQQGRLTSASSGVGSDFTLLASGTLATVGTLDIVLTSFTAYRVIQIVLGGFRCSTDDTALYMRTSTNGGSSYDAGGSDYRYANFQIQDNGSILNTFSTGETHITLTTDQVGDKPGNSAGEAADYVVWLPNRKTTSTYNRILFQGSYTNLNIYHVTGAGVRASSGDVDAVRFLYAAGNITAGTYAIYGMM